MELFTQGFDLFFTITNIGLINIGIIVGIVFGAIPGLTANIGLILALPITFAFQPISAISMLLGIYVGGQYGGSISAILLGVPGTGSAAADLLDGRPLALRGSGRKASLIALYSSVIGGVFSALCLLLFSPLLARAALLIAPPEYFVLAIFGLTIIAGVSGKNLLIGILSASLGMFISVIGMDSQTGVLRFGFGSLNLFNGFALVTLMFGTFAFPNLLNMIRTKAYDKEVSESFKLNNKEKVSRAEMKQCAAPIAKGSIIGALIGAIPGTGAAIAAYMSYSNAKSSSKHPERFGTGALEGIAAPESANSATTASSFIPLFTLGIPGTIAAATLVGALTVHGLTPGPGLFRNHGVTMYAIMISFIFINLFVLLQGRYLAGFFAKILNVPSAIIIPALTLISLAGAYAVTGRMFNLYAAIGFAFFFYILSKFGFIRAPFIVGMVLGPLAEVNLSRSLVMGEGSVWIFFTRPISAVLIAFTLYYAFTTLRRNRKLYRSENTGSSDGENPESKNEGSKDS